MKLTSINEVKNLMASHGVAFNKSFGQNFLINEAIPERIADECGASPDDSILEIGPGIGTLTCELCKRYKKVVAVEIDSGLIPILNDTTSGFGNITVINSDILKVDLNSLYKEYFNNENVTVCANLPYYITSPILMKLIESDVKFDHITVMVQKEVAVRLASEPESAEYGAIAATVQRYAEVERLFSVGPGNFIPAPKVDSAVIRITPYKERKYSVRDEKLMTRVIRGAFAQRRKNLVNSLSTEFGELSKADLTEILENAGFSSSLRGETLGTDGFAKIADAVYDFRKEKNNDLQG